MLIFDEVFVGFRLAPGGAQEYFGVKADMVTYGKTLGGGLPIGVLCGRKELMKRFRDDRPADICFARGTFNAHPYVMTAMNEFLHRLETPEVRNLYKNLDAPGTGAPSGSTPAWPRRLPVQVANLPTIWTVLYTQPAATTGCFNSICGPRGWRLAGWARAGSSSVSTTATPTSTPWPTSSWPPRGP